MPAGPGEERCSFLRPVALLPLRKWLFDLHHLANLVAAHQKVLVIPIAEGDSDGHFASDPLSHSTTH